MIDNQFGRRPVRAARFVLQSSFVAMAIAIPNLAMAQCSPDPTSASSPVTCSGSDSNGITITSNLSPLTVESGASVANSGASAITISIPASTTYYQRSAAVIVNGTVSASGAAGINVLSGPLGSNSYDYYGTLAAITVGAGASINGTYGISVGQTAGNAFANTYVDLDNSGTISGTSGIALLTASNYATFRSILNRSTGTIGAIVGTADTITNEGTIDGGSLSAISNSFLTYSPVTNKGIIRSSNGSATILNYSGTIANSGTITNSGTGSAIASTFLNVINQAGGSITGAGSSVLTTSPTSMLTLTNAGTIANNGVGTALYGGTVNLTNSAGGTITGGSGGTAIDARDVLSLTNSGTINGNVLAGVNGSPYSASYVDSTAGTINGNVIFGGGNDTLVATIKDGSLYTGISGSVNGGGGINAVRVRTTSDTTLSSPLTLPTNFSTLDLTPVSGTTVILADGFTVTGTLGVGGAGTIDNQTTLTSSGQIIGASGVTGQGTFKNSGSIISTASGNTWAAQLTLYTSLNNTGTISSTANGIATSFSAVSNSGTITASGTALSSYYVNGPLANSGTITGGSVGVSFTGGTLLNTGTIQSANIGVQLGSNSVLDNRAGAVISGGVSASNVFSVSVINAGTINDNVNLSNGSPYYDAYNGNRYYALAGGVLNGDLTLGQGDMLVTSLTNSGTGAFSGITGTVNANNSRLVYNVDGAASASTSAPAGFSSLTYQLASGSSLALSTSGTVASSLFLAGTGTVTLDGAINLNNRILLQTAPLTTLSGTIATTSAITLINNGSVTVTHDNSANYITSALWLFGNDNLVNNGRIAMTDTTGTNASNAAIQSAVSITDNTITTAGRITNNGTITTTGINAVGLNGQYGATLNGTLINSGQVSSDLAAVVLNGAGTIINSGSLLSTGGTAIKAQSNLASSITNLAGGTITGVGTAIQMGGGYVRNAGTINGDVNLAYSIYGGSSYNTSIYVADGGILNGNLTFGSSNDLLVETGSGFGVNGTINGGGGTNFIGHQRNGTATVTLGGDLLTGFTREFTVAAGSASRVTLVGPSSYTGTIYVGGDGTIINQLATTGRVYSLNTAGIAYTPYSSSELAGFDNQANVGGVSLNTGTFSNAATIGASSLASNAVALSTAKGFSFNNSGTILNNAQSAAVALTGTSLTSDSAINNSGTITGDIALNADTANGTTFTITNSGTITGSSRSYYYYTNTPPYYALRTTVTALNATVVGAKSFDLVNSGTITGDLLLNGSDVNVTNSGTIIGNIYTGTGNDAFGMAGTFTGALDGGSGTNSLSISGGNQSFSSISNISDLAQSGGLSTVSGIATLGALDMTGGRFIGLAGSVLNAPTITIGSGATFGSAGTVNGNLSISGILSPGASPGNMTVNGNVALNNGSTSLFEITPTAQDKLIVNGQLVIASGSTLQIAASTPVKVGSTLNLISASGGIAGSFDAVTGLAGVVKTQANGDLDLLVQFANSSSYNPQIQRAISYMNKTMAADGAPTALFPALSALQDANGLPVPSAFARVTPEPYADAMQIGTETALSLATSARTMGTGEATGPHHGFAFGQALGSLRQFGGRETHGINRATINGYGMLGGLGVGGEGYALSAYVGWVDQNQSVANIGASTNARGVVGGVALRLGTRATQVTLSASYDAARAKTQRNVPDAGQITSSYLLPTVALDASIGHEIALSKGWQLRPHIGATWIMTRHSAMTEASPHPFALTIEEATRKQGFIDAGLEFASPTDAKGPWRRFLALGMRYRLRNNPVTATAGLAGGGYGLVAYGVERDRISAMLATGVEYRMAPGAVFFINAAAELGKNAKRETVNAGIHWKI